MSVIIILAVLGGIVFPATLYCLEIHKRMTWALVAKTVSSLSFVALGYICSGYSALPEFVRLFWIGEIFGAVGDVLINLWPWFKNRNISLCIGGISFFIGHVFYVVAVYSVNHGGLCLSLILTAIVFAIVIIMLYRLTAIEPVMKVLITLYMLFVSAFFAFSLSAFIAHPCFERVSLALGALFFLASDFDLMLNNFGKKKNDLVFKFMYLYYPAQVIIALCLYWFV